MLGVFLKKKKKRGMLGVEFKGKTYKFGLDWPVLPNCTPKNSALYNIAVPRCHDPRGGERDIDV